MLFKAKQRERVFSHDQLREERDVSAYSRAQRTRRNDLNSKANTADADNNMPCARAKNRAM
jgi:hypothetical protein